MNRFFENKASTATVVYLLLFILLALRVGGAVSHYCFDGMEPPVTVHFDNLNGHIDHADEAGHTDIEKQVLADNLTSKLFEFDSFLVLLALFLLALLSLSGGQAYFYLATQRHNSPRKFWPPLRAPPVFA